MVKRNSNNDKPKRSVPKKLKNKIKHKFISVMDLPERKVIKKRYKSNSKIIRQVSRAPGAKIAVVLHLYYPESWGFFKQTIKEIDRPFDLFITLPAHEQSFTADLKKDYPGAHIVTTPNRGRDVLPFLGIANELKKLGYEYVLKLHSKKSTHRTDGQDWLADMARKLIPRDKKIQKKLLDVLADPSSAIVGPEGQYLSLRVNFEANGTHMTDILSSIYSTKVAHKVLQTERNEHGFFAGTMFWARLDGLLPILNRNYTVSKFEKESGQIDATFAHALERVFCLVPQIEKKDIYEIGPRGIKKIDYKTTNIPDWSDVYISPKPETKNPGKR